MNQIERKRLKLRDWWVKVGKVGMENRIGIPRLVIKGKYSREDWNVYFERVWGREKGRGREPSSDTFFLVAIEEKLSGNHGEWELEFIKMHFEITTAGNFLGNQKEMNKRMCVRKDHDECNLWWGREIQ